MVAADADLDTVLPLLVKGDFYHAGQVCVSVQRVFAHADIAREVAGRMAALAKALVIGDHDPTVAETEVGPLIRPAEVDRVAQWVGEAKDGGAEVLCGGEKVSDTCYAATVLYDPPAEAQISVKEVFGPAVCVYPYRDIDEAIARANSIPFAFHAAVCTRDIDTALRAYRRLDAISRGDGQRSHRLPRRLDAVRRAPPRVTAWAASITRSTTCRAREDDGRALDGTLGRAGFA